MKKVIVGLALAAALSGTAFADVNGTPIKAQRAGEWVLRGGYFVADTDSPAAFEVKTIIERFNTRAECIYAANQWLVIRNRANDKLVNLKQKIRSALRCSPVAIPDAYSNETPVDIDNPLSIQP